ncbi:MAG: UDP-2,3-diacylglucosamine diphosphatase [Desulfurivibrio sp.]|nr:UDP-2,3-diacylglucosamine diphosphatase [Desulfurivibrio sp.]
MKKTESSHSPSQQPRHFRAIWLSDLHLGSRDINSAALLDFLKRHKSDYLYLVGDIFDFWKVNNGWHWPEINNQIVDLVLERAENGTEVIYIPGNHDEMLRKYVHTEIKGVKILPEVLHRTADGRRFLILHGDRFDLVTTYNRWLAKLGSEAYQVLLRLNRYHDFCRSKLGLGHWSLSAFCKHQVKVVVNFIGDFKQEIAQEARRRQVDGLICGHIHHASYETIDEIIYTNTGDWVESCTALVEDKDGKLIIFRWRDEPEILVDERAFNSGAMEAYADCYRNRGLAPTS